MSGIVYSIIAAIAFLGPAVVLLALSGERWPRRVLCAGATFLPVVIVVVAGVISEALGGPGLGVHSDFIAVLVVAGLFGGWAVLIHYLKRQERNAS